MSRKKVCAFVVESVAELCPVVPATSDHTTGGARLVALCRWTLGLAVQFSVNVVAVLVPTDMLPGFAMTVPVIWKLSKLRVPPAPVKVKTSPAPVTLPVKLLEATEPMAALLPVPVPLTDNESHCEAAGLNVFE